MKQKYYLLIFFVLLSAMVAGVAHYYKKSWIHSYEHQTFDNISNKLVHELSTRIEDKRNGTLSIALSLAQNSQIASMLKHNRIDANFLRDFSQQLRQKTQYKNVWFELIDNKGITKVQSWLDNPLVNTPCHNDIKPLLLEPKVSTHIMINAFDLIYSAMVPLYDENKQFLGYLHTITHFNSIAKQLTNQGHMPLILVDPKHAKTVTKPLSKIFIDGYYVANLDANTQALAYFKKHDISSLNFTSSHYRIDTKNRLLITNYTLFSKAQKPLAQILVFTPMKNIDLNYTSTIKTTVNLVWALSTLSIAFVLFMLYKKEHNFYAKIQKERKNLILVFGAVFVVLFVVTFMLTKTYFDTRKNEYISAHNRTIAKDYEIIYEKYKALSNALFDSIINEANIHHVMYQAYSNHKSQARDALKHILKNTYETYKSYNLRQMHFHLKDNESFLRFHRPQKFGDNLTHVRPTVSYVNTHLKPIDGFEEGRIFNGFRYVYPMLLMQEDQSLVHVGSVELSFSVQAFLEDFQNSHNAKSDFIIDANLVSNSVFLSEQDNYIPSAIQGYFNERHLKEFLKKHSMHIETQLLSTQTLQKATTLLKQGIQSSHISQNSEHIFTFIPIKHPLTHKTIASIVLQTTTTVFKTLEQTFVLVFALIVVLLALVIIFTFREIDLKRSFQSLSKKAQSILDAQDSIVVITSSDALVDANKKFLEFFGYKTVEEFFKEHRCISEYFIEDASKYFCTKEITHDHNWIEALLERSSRKRIVAMYSKTRELHVFIVSINTFDRDFIVTFSDITDTINEQFSLRERATVDKLTGAYNRDYFEHHIKAVITNAHEKNHTIVVTIFDIDFFKNINDTHGHITGDTILRQLVEVVKEHISLDTMFIRWGGEEFVLVHTVEQKADALQLANTLRQVIEAYTFDDKHRITCSFGVALHAYSSAIQETLEHADKALYKAKEQGRNQVQSA